MIWQMQNSQDYNDVFVFSQLNMVKLPVEWSSCDRWLFFNYIYNKDSRYLQLDLVSRDDYIDDRVYIGYEWFYSSEIQITYYQLLDNGTLTLSSESYKIDFKTWYEDLWWVWVIIAVVVFGCLCVARHFYLKKKSQRSPADNARPQTGLAATDGGGDDQNPQV